MMNWEYAVKIKQDDNGKWGYKRNHHTILVETIEDSFYHIVAELETMKKTLRGREHYTEKISRDIELFLDKLGDENVSDYADFDKYFDKRTHEIYFSFDYGNASCEIIAIPIETHKIGSSLTIDYKDE